MAALFSRVVSSNEQVLMDYKVSRTYIGQRTLAFTNQMLLRVFSCNFLRLSKWIIIYTSASIHSHLRIRKEQYTIQENKSIKHAHVI
jgi:aspartate carbamoyltransferase catalytic subunit